MENLLQGRAYLAAKHTLRLQSTRRLHSQRPQRWAPPASSLTVSSCRLTACIVVTCSPLCLICCQQQRHTGVGHIAGDSISLGCAHRCTGQQVQLRISAAEHYVNTGPGQPALVVATPCDETHALCFFTLSSRPALQRMSASCASVRSAWDRGDPGHYCVQHSGGEQRV